MPFDRFTIEQIAGDLLPNATQEQILATAFHRNTLTNNEGGTNDEEFRVAAVVDRVNTTMQVWMGLTMGCAQCHDHKYDPISQEEYFHLFAILNQTRGPDKSDNSPNLTVITPGQAKQKAELEATIADARQGAARAESEVRRRPRRSGRRTGKRPTKLPANDQADSRRRCQETQAQAQKLELTKYFRSIAAGVEDSSTTRSRRLEAARRRQGRCRRRSCASCRTSKNA